MRLAAACLRLLPIAGVAFACGCGAAPAGALQRVLGGAAGFSDLDNPLIYIPITVVARESGHCSC